MEIFNVQDLPIEVWVEIDTKKDYRRVVLTTLFGEIIVDTFSHSFFLKTKLCQATQQAKEIARVLGRSFILILEDDEIRKEYIGTPRIKVRKLNTDEII